MKLLLALIALFLGTTASWAQKDVTSQYITNATLSNGTTGWTNENFNTPVRGNNTVGYASECYAGWGSLEKTSYSLTQKITLPAGHYTLVNYSFFRYGLNADTDASKSLAFLKAGNDQVAVKTLGSITAAGYANSQAEGANAFDSKMYRNALDFTIDANNTEIEIGLYGTFDLKQSWMICGMFELINNDIAATMDAPFDVTGYITNPGFEYRDMTGWTVTGGIHTQNNSQTFKVGGYYAQNWQSSANGALPAASMSQTLTNLPAGFYKLTANLGGNGTYLDLNGKTTNWEADKDYTVGYVLSENEDLVITAGKTAEGTANWIHFDNFRLQFCGDVAAALTTLCAEVTNYENQLSASDYATLLSAVNGYNKSYSDVDELLAAIDAVQALYESADLYIEYTTALDAANAIKETPMNGDVLSALQTAIANTVTMASTAAEKVAATNALNTATANANTSIANYAEAKVILDAANSYDAAGQASYAADETIAAIQSAYDDRTLTAVTAEQKAAAQAALATACKAQIQPADGCDMTAYIVNPNFETNDLSGWTNSGMQTQTNKAFGGTIGDIYCEAWQPNGTKSISQTMTLPQGLYRMSANSLARGVTSAKLYAGDAETAITIEDAYNTYSVEFKCADNATIGFEGVGTGASTSWLCVDNFQLTYVRQLTSEEIEIFVKAEAVAAYNKALAAAQAIKDDDIPSTAYSNLQTVITNNTLSDGTADQYNAAATAISEAATAAQALVAPYAAWKELKAYADALVAVSTNNTDENATLASAISTQNTTVEAATTADAITTATSTLKGAMVTYATTAEPTNDECFDLTFMIVNPHFTEGNATNPTGWTVNYPARTDGQWGGASELRLSTHNFEAYHKQFTLSQTIPDLPKGTYKVTLQGFARHDDASVIDKTNLFCGIVNQTIKDINAEYSATSFYNNTMPALGDTNYDATGTLDGNTIYRPNGMTGAYYWFQEENPATNQPFYTSEVQTFIKTAGDLTIGFKCETWSDWVIWDNFHLYYYGSAIAVTIDENEAVSIYDEDIENANITLKRTFNAGKWNTIALPFDLSDDETKAAFGSDAKVATFSETPNAEGYNDSEVSFNIAPDAAITANTPVLLKTSTEETTFTFKGKTIEAGEAKIEGVNFDFVGTYAASTTIAEKDYFISNNQLWRSTGNTTIKGTRAYLKGKVAGARIAEFSIGESETTGISTIASQKANNAAYDMQGRRVETLKKGVYVVNGKKVVVK